MPEDLSEFGIWLEEQIEGSGKNYADLARYLEVTTVTIWRWKTEGKASPPPYIRKAIGGFLNTE